MNIQYQLDTFINLSTQKIKESLSSKKKNIAIISYYPTYRSNYGNLIAELKKDYNVITIVDRILNDEFEKSAHHNFHFPWRIIENGTHYYLNTDIPKIDFRYENNSTIQECDCTFTYQWLYHTNNGDATAGDPLGIVGTKD